MSSTRKTGAAVLLIVGLTSPGCGEAPPDPAVPSTASEIRMLSVSDGEIAFEVTGSGEAVVLIHGGFGDRRMWDPVVAPLSQDFRVVRYDQRGFGGSPAPTAPYDPIDDLLRLLDHLGLDRAYLVGNSMGGTLALDFALVHPDRVRRLVLAAAGPGGFAVPEEDIRRIMAVFDTARSEGLDAAAAQWLAHPMVKVTSRSERMAPLLRTMIRDNARAFLMPVAHWPAETADPPAYARLGDVVVPVLVVAGSEDTSLVLQMAEATATGVANGELVVIQGADHLPQMSHPEAFERTVREFLRSRAGGG